MMPSGTPQITVSLPIKRWWKSRTLWLNALVLIASVAEEKLNFLQPVLPVNVYAVVAFTLPVANALLRIVTVQRLGGGAAAGGVPS